MNLTNMQMERGCTQMKHMFYSFTYIKFTYIYINYKCIYEFISQTDLILVFMDTYLISKSIKKSKERFAIKFRTVVTFCRWEG